MKVSVIIAVYKDIQSLDLILEGLKKQTYKNFEVIVAEDNNTQMMADYIKTVEGLEILHTFQEDSGVRKSRSQNNGILASTGEYLIFIDGDIIPYSTFIEGHVALASKSTVLAGRRVNLPENITEKLRSGKISSYTLERFYWLFAFYFMFDRNTRFEQGIHLNPYGWIYSFFIAKRRRNTSLIGCNFSCFKENMIAINGFDESFGESSLSDDVDLDWRFRAYGLVLKSCKNSANAFHLFHKKQNNPTSPEQREKFKKNKADNKFKTESGLNLHE